MGEKSRLGGELSELLGVPPLRQVVVEEATLSEYFMDSSR